MSRYRLSTDTLLQSGSRLVGSCQILKHPHLSSRQPASWIPSSRSQDRCVHSHGEAFLIRVAWNAKSVISKRLHEVRLNEILVLFRMCVT